MASPSPQPQPTQDASPVPFARNLNDPRQLESELERLRREDPEKFEYVKKRLLSFRRTLVVEAADASLLDHYRLSPEFVDVYERLGLLSRRDAEFIRQKYRILTQEQQARALPRKPLTPEEQQAQQAQQEEAQAQQALSLQRQRLEAELRRAYVARQPIALGGLAGLPIMPFPERPFNVPPDMQIIEDFDEVPELRSRHAEGGKWVPGPGGDMVRRDPADDWDTVHLEIHAPKLPRLKSANNIMFEFPLKSPDIIKDYQRRMAKANLLPEGYIAGDGTDTGTIQALQEVMRQAALRNMSIDEALSYLELHPEIGKSLMDQTGRSGGGGATKEDRMLAALRQVYFDTWGVYPQDSYLQPFVKSGMNIYEFAAHERSKPAFEASPRYQYDRIQLENRLWNMFGYGG